MPPKGYIAVVLALLLGLVLGRWAPQADLREARTQLADSRRNTAGRKPAGGAAAIAGVQSILKATEHGSPAADTARDRLPAASPGPSTTPDAARNATESTQRIARAGGPTQAVARASFSNNLDQIREGWVMRTQIARANFVSRAELDAQQAGDFDTLVEAMNLRLGASIDAWVARVSQKGQLSSEDGVRILNEVSSALVLSYNEMDRKLPPEWRQKAGSSFELVNLVDPDVLTPLQDIDGLINTSARSPAHNPPSEFGVHVRAAPNKAAP